MRGLSLLDCEIIECMDSIPYALFLYLISGKMQKSNVTSFLRVVLKNSQENLLLTTVKHVLSVLL